MFQHVFRSDTNEKTQNVFLVLLYSKIKIQFFELAFKIWLLQWFKNTIFVSIKILTTTATYFDFSTSPTTNKSRMTTLFFGTNSNSSQTDDL